MTENKFRDHLAKKKRVEVREGFKYGLIDSIVNLSTRNIREMVVVDDYSGMTEEEVIKLVSKEYSFFTSVDCKKLGCVFHIKWNWSAE